MQTANQFQAGSALLARFIVPRRRGLRSLRLVQSSHREFKQLLRLRQREGPLKV